MLDCAQALLAPFFVGDWNFDSDGLRHLSGDGSGNGGFQPGVDHGTDVDHVLAIPCTILIDWEDARLTFAHSNLSQVHSVFVGKERHGRN